MKALDKKIPKRDVSTGNILNSNSEPGREESNKFQSTANNNSIFDSFLDFYIRTDIKGIIRKVSPSCFAITGYTPEELLGRKAVDFYPDPKHWERLIETLLLNGAVYDYEVTFRNKAGNHIPVIVSSHVIKDEKGIAVAMEGIVRDISKRKKAEDSLKAREELLKATIESTADGILVVNDKGETILTNTKFIEMWRIPEELIKTRDDSKLIEYVLNQLRDPDAFIAKVKQLYESIKHSLDTLYFKDGRVFERYSCPLIQNEKLAGRVWSFRDITGLIKAGKLVRESDRKYESLFNTIHDGIISVDLEENILFVNRAACDVLGFSEKELIGKNIMEFVVHGDHEKISRETAKRKRNEISRYEITIIRKNGEQRDISLSVTPYLDDSGAIISAVGVFSDITEFKRTEKEKHELKEKLINAQRMESLGVLAGGVAHDLNNILGPLVAYPQLIKAGLPQDSPINAKLDKIEKSAQRAADVVQDLLTLARRGRYEMNTLDINESIDSYLKSTDFSDIYSKYDNIRLKHFQDVSIPKVRGSSTHLYKVIMNLAINAIDAMPTGGDLTIKTECRNIRRLAGGFSRIEPGKYIIITISDSGTGIEKKDLERIFEPFYSKKKLGKSGSGLGLAIVYGVVKDHNGYVDVISEIDKGSSFYVYLPAVFSDTEQVVKNETFDIRGSETILIVDDVEEQRELADTVLSSLGYRVITVPDGEEAIEYLQENSVDLVVLDMIMDPGIDGLDTYKSILEINPNQKAIISTGFSETDRVKEAERLGVGRVVKKPYTMQILGKAIRELFADKDEIQKAIPRI
ncbi:MAG: PAS domain S-box protein [candidate division Zixibacteria bacterium]